MEVTALADSTKVSTAGTTLDFLPSGNDVDDAGVNLKANATMLV